MVDLIVRACTPPESVRSVRVLRVQLKDKKGSRGTYLHLHDLEHEEGVTMQVGPGYRLKAWYIGPDEKLVPGTTPEKRTITEQECRGYQAFGLLVYYESRMRRPAFLYDTDTSH
jgi:hypothetical protein